MVNKKQIDALQSILETANEKFNNGLDLIHKDLKDMDISCMKQHLKICLKLM